jgi:hypothetical protein
MAMRMPSDLGSSGLGSVQRTQKILITLDLETKERKKAVLKLCLVKRKLLKEKHYNMN